LFQRLKKENRIVDEFDGTNMATNFIPRMNAAVLVDGYKHILQSIYSPREYYQRVGTFLKDFKPPRLKGAHLGFHHVKALWKSFWILGWKETGKRYYWRLMLATFFKRPRSFPVAVKLAIYGYHFRRVVEKYSGEKLGLRAIAKSFS
jgi:hypothetical protein